MDAPKVLTLTFEVDGKIITREAKEKFIVKRIPESILGACIRDQVQCDSIAITDFSPEEWDRCVLIAKGKAPLYLPGTYGDRIREVYQRYFGGHVLDNARISLVSSCDNVCQSALDLLSKSKQIVYVSSEGAYSQLKDLAGYPNIIPLQMITLNGKPFMTCFDHGYPFGEDGYMVDLITGQRTSLHRARNAALGVLRAKGVFEYTYVPEGVDERQELHKKYSMMDWAPAVHANMMQPVHYYGAGAGGQGATGATGPGGPPHPLAANPCCDQCIRNNEDIKEKCRCFAYTSGRTHTHKDLFLESLIDLSSLDELKFIRSAAYVTFCDKSYLVKFVDLVPNIPCPHTHEQYTVARAIVTRDMPPSSASIHNTIVAVDQIRLEIFLGFVRVD